MFVSTATSLIFVLLMENTQVVYSDDCQWTGNRDNKLYCYWLVETPSSFDDAEAICVASQGHLATIDSQQTRDLIVSFLTYVGHLTRYPSAYIWIGYNDEGRYWNDGTLFEYNNWYPGQPSSAFKDCVALGAEPAWRWFDERCSSDFHSLCQKELKVKREEYHHVPLGVNIIATLDSSETAVSLLRCSIGCARQGTCIVFEFVASNNSCKMFVAGGSDLAVSSDEFYALASSTVG